MSFDMNWFLLPGKQSALVWTPIIALTTIAYLPTVFLLKKYYKNRPAFKHNWVLISWNLMLSVLSAAGSATILWFQPDIVFTSKVDPDSYLVPVRFVIATFCVTKFMEYGDTIFLVIKKRPTIFLHLYHHVTVTIYCWHALYSSVNYGHIFAFVNLNIHAVMYLYYAMAIVIKKSPFLRACRPYITLMQTAQMFLGIYLSAQALTEGLDLPVQYWNAVSAFVMYLSYAYLFASFFVSNYTSYCEIDFCAIVSVMIVLGTCIIKSISAIPSISLYCAVASVLSVVSCSVVWSLVGKLTNESIIAYSSPIGATCDELKDIQSNVRGIKGFVKKHNGEKFVNRLFLVSAHYTAVPLSAMFVSYLNGGSNLLVLLILSAAWACHGWVYGCFKTVDLKVTPLSSPTSRVSADEVETTMKPGLKQRFAPEINEQLVRADVDAGQ